MDLFNGRSLVVLDINLKLFSSLFFFSLGGLFTLAAHFHAHLIIVILKMHILAMEWSGFVFFLLPLVFPSFMQILFYRYSIVSTGGTAFALEEAGVSVTKVEEITHFPEMVNFIMLLSLTTCMCPLYKYLD